ncbi:MAG TPA: nitrate reductase [Armatimonadota bacterium]|nr:nitrate reductase [Armatimonadota bacterium]
MSDAIGGKNDSSRQRGSRDQTGPHDRGSEDVTGEAICPYCGVGCRLVARARNGRVISVRGAADAAANHGRICPKGATLAQVIDTPDRAIAPLIREDRSRPFRAVSWDEANRFLADRLNAIIAENGPSAFGFYGSGQLDTEAAYCAARFVKGGLKTNNTDSNSRLCMASAVAGYRSSLGSDGPPPCYADIADASVILILGSNMADAHPVTFEFVRAKKRVQPETFIIVVDPRRTRTARFADLYVQIRPGSDVAFLNAIAYFLVTRGLIDHRFVRESTTGFDELADDLESQNVRDLAAVCGVEPGALLTLADRIGTAGRFLSFYGMGINQSAAGVDKNNCILNLHLITGQIGKKGAGPFSLTGQPNAMGGREAGLLRDSLPGYRRVEQDEDRREMEDAWSLPPGSIESSPGLSAVKMFRSLAAGSLKAIWIAGTNPMVSLPDLNASRVGLENAELVIVQDCYYPTETSDYAHVILPAAQWIEKEGTSTNSERMVTYSERVLDPPGEARPDWRIFCGVAQSMGLPGFDFPDAAAVWDEFRQLTRGRVCDQSGMTAARLRRERSIQWPCPNESGPGAQRLYTDGRFPTPDGRARIFTRRHRTPGDPVCEQYPLVLTTGRLAAHWHTRTRTRHVELLERQEPEPFLEINPTDAVVRAIQDGDIVEVRSRRGLLKTRARISTAPAPGTVFAAFHWGDRFRVYASANALTPAELDPVSDQPEYKYCAVEVRACTIERGDDTAAQDI